MKLKSYGLALMAVVFVGSDAGLLLAQDFASVEISVVVAKRKDVIIVQNEETQESTDPAKKAAHLDGIASATLNGEANTEGSTLSFEETDGDGDGFIDMTQNNPGNSGANGKNPDVPTGHLRIDTLSYANNSYVGTGIFIFDSDGDGKITADDDGDENTDDDLNDDGLDDDDQMMPVTVRCNLRSNAHGPFLGGTFHAVFDEGTVGVNEDGTALVPGDAQSQPRINGRIRSSRNGK